MWRFSVTERAEWIYGRNREKFDRNSNGTLVGSYNPCKFDRYPKTILDRLFLVLGLDNHAYKYTQYSLDNLQRANRINDQTSKSIYIYFLPLFLTLFPPSFNRAFLIRDKIAEFRTLHDEKGVPILSNIRPVKPRQEKSVFHVSPSGSLYASLLPLPRVVPLTFATLDAKVSETPVSETVTETSVVSIENIDENNIL